MPYTPEDARNILTHGDLGDINVYFWEAVRDEQLPRYYSQRLAVFKCYSDELPDQPVGARHPQFPFMKCRGSTSMSVSLMVRQCVDQLPITDPDIHAAANAFAEYPWAANQRGESDMSTTKEEILYMNTTIDLFLGYIESAYGVIPNWEEAQQELNRNREEWRRTSGLANIL